MMAWGTPLTAVANAALTASQWNASVRDNLLETGVAKTTTAGSYAAGAGPNSVAERLPTTSNTLASETTTSTSYTDLTTTGPSVTVTVSAFALTLMSATLSNNTVNATSYMSSDVSGATSSSAADSRALQLTSATANASVAASYCALFSLAPGSSSITGKYRVTSGTGSFSNRRLIVLPF